MIIIIPILYFAIYCCLRQKKVSKPESVARTILIYQVFVLIITNLFSIFHCFQKYFLIASYILFLLVCVIYFVNNRPETADKNDFSGDSIKSYVKQLDRYMLCMMSIMGIFGIILLVGAIFTVPYNYDSMTYHLGRIGYWIDNQSVNHYITNIDRQLFSPVLAEYNLLHIMTFSSNDTFVNFLQYASLFASTYLIYHTCRRLGTSQRFSMFGAFAFFMMPLTISQSITTQNDLFAALFFVIFVFELVEVIKWKHLTFSKEQRKVILYLSLCVAFAYLAKTSVCASMLMFMPWLFIVCIKRKDKCKALFQSASLALVTILIGIFETLIRTFMTSGAIMTDTASGDIMVATKNISYIVVNILKNFSLLITQHICRPLNGFVYRIAIGLGQNLNVDVNNEAIAFHGFDFLRHMNMGEDMYSHDKTPSAFVTYLALIAGALLVVLIIYLFLKSKKLTKEKKEQYSLSIGFGISTWISLGFIMALLRWQPWGTRLMYPALVITTIMSANLLWLLLGNKRWQIWIMGPLSAICLMLAIVPTQYNMQQAISYLNNRCMNRMSYYFVYNQRLDSYEELLSLAKENECQNIGLLISGDGYDYPLWLLFKREYAKAEIHHIVDGNYDDFKNEQAPDALLMVEKGAYEKDEIYELGKVEYICVYANADIGDAFFVKLDN